MLFRQDTASSLGMEALRFLQERARTTDTDGGLWEAITG